MYDQTPRSDVPQSNIIQRLFSHSWRGLFAEIALTLVIALAAGSAFDLFGPLDGAADATPIPAQMELANDFLQIADAYATLGRDDDSLRNYEQYLRFAGNSADPAVLSRMNLLRGGA